MSKRKKKKLTEAQLQQRRNAAAKSTGPKTTEGKRASSRNAIKHSRYAQTIINGPAFKPCKSTCPQYDTCEHIKANDTKPGQRCLDRRALVEAYDAIIIAMQDNEFSTMQEIAAFHIAGNLDVIVQLRADIAERGAVLEKILYNKDGAAIGSDTVLHPAVAVLPKLCEQLGLNLPQFLATPAARAKLDHEEEELETAATVFGRIASKFQGLEDKVSAIDAEVVK